MIFIFNVEFCVHFQIYWYISSTVHLVGVYQTVSDRIELYSYRWYWTISYKICSHRSL